MVCIYAELLLSYLDFFVDKARALAMLKETATQWLLDCVRDNSLGVTSEGWRSDAPAHDTIRLTSRCDVRLVLRDRSQGVETDQTL